MLWLKCRHKLGEMVHFHHSTKVVRQASGDVKVQWLSETLRSWYARPNIHTCSVRQDGKKMESLRYCK